MAKIQTSIAPVCLHIVKKSVLVRPVGKSVGGKEQENRTWYSQMIQERKTEVGEWDRAKHAVEEDKQKSKHRGKPEGRHKR